MTSMNEAAIILKRDAGGRVVVVEQQRVDLVRAYERSGLSGPKFAALVGVNYQTFATWRRKHGTQPPSRRRASPGAAGPTWVEAELRPDSSEGLTVLLPGGATVAVSRPGQVALAAELLKALACASC